MKVFTQKTANNVYRYCIYVIVFFLLYFGISPVLKSQAFTHYNTGNSGIPENLVFCITLDTNGVKWIGTDFGLAVFDDVNWQVYSTSNSGLPHNSVRSIYIDAANVKWIGTLNGGLTRFDGNTWTTYNTFNSNLCDDNVHDVKTDTAGKLWIATTKGLSCFHNNAFTNYTKGTYPFLTDHFTKIFINPDDTKLFCTLNGGLVTLTDTVFEIYTVFNNNFPDNSQLDIVRDTSGKHWLASVFGGLIVYMGPNLWTSYNSNTSSIPFNGLTCLEFNNAGDLFIGTSGDGLIVKTGLQFLDYNMTNSSIGDNVIEDLMIDSSGTLWLCSESAGLIKVNTNALGIAASHATGNAQCFPNPAHDYMSISTASTARRVVIKDTEGKYLTAIPGNGEKVIGLRLTDLEPGIYFMDIEYPQGIQEHLKFIKL